MSFHRVYDPIATIAIPTIVPFVVVRTDWTIDWISYHGYCDRGIGIAIVGSWDVRLCCCYYDCYYCYCYYYPISFVVSFVPWKPEEKEKEEFQWRRRRKLQKDDDGDDDGWNYHSHHS